MWTDIGINNVFQEGGKDVRLRFGKKPEMLLERIINTFTDEGDLVLDFFAGTGTTAAVAHKLRRRWLAIEQLEDVLNQAVSRLKRVVMGDQTGISKSVFWKGGGSFVYAELADSNSFFANRIKEAKKHSTLLSILSDMQQTGFLRYDVRMGDFDEDEFVNLSLKDAKHALLDCLDVNHLHVNLHSLGDDDFSVSNEDADTTRKFYAL
ncbi:site-specific DNA-methyltransferase [Candidatus Poribacteria bacterium]|nr:site-specific DNA-methyltransferase [Candidatus Poribacteria bacterium]